MDMVNHPKHYKSNSGIEVIEVIEAFTEDLKGVEAVSTANVIKYICRWKKKNGLEDLKKAQWYLTHLIQYVEECENFDEGDWLEHNKNNPHKTIKESIEYNEDRNPIQELLDVLISASIEFNNDEEK